jgi:cytochrome c peroxidase
MRAIRFGRLWLSAWSAVGAIAISIDAPAGAKTPNLQAFANAGGIAHSYSTAGAIDADNPFFESLGTNGRSCASCHQPSDGWSITPKHVRQRFAASGGEDPIFRTVDGSNSPYADVTTIAARRRAYSLLLSKGLVRIGLGMPAGAEFDLVDVDDPYHYASAAELSLFRRPLPATNLRFLATVMWDGRETFAGRSIEFDLAHQANSATLTHAEAVTPLTRAQRSAIVAFQTTLFTAQVFDNAAGVLRGRGTNAGPVPLSRQPFFIGINDPFLPGFTPNAFTLFEAWLERSRSRRDSYATARESIARGERIFNTRPLVISGVRGVNDRLGVDRLEGTCTTCHDTPNVGNHSVSLPLDLGLSDAAMRTPDLPLYTFRNTGTGETVQTTDPGRALVTGRWNDMSTFKGPILRGLAARPPYFHNGAAATLADVVTFYNSRFDLRLSRREATDLVAFLKAL